MFIMPRQSKLKFRQKLADADKAQLKPTRDNATTSSASQQLHAPLTPPPSQLSIALPLPKSAVMDPSYDLADSTDWLSTSLPAFEPLEAALRCEVCKEFYNNPVITACSHTFCSLCIRRCISNDGKCPACKNACQADKLVANIVVREVATRFQDARAKALELARAEDKAGAETAASGKKRKIEETDVDDEEEGRRTRTRSRQTRSARREEANTTMEGDAVIIPDSDDENANDEEYVPEGMAKCPICNEIMKMEAVFNHVPVCPAAEHDNGGRNTRSR